MNLKCEHCGGKLRPNKEKIAIEAVSGTGLALSGWLTAATAGMATPSLIISLSARKALFKAAKNSNKESSFFQCKDCGEGASLSYVFGD